MAGPYKLYGVHLSYFTGKVRAFLLNKRLPFDEIGSTEEVFREIIVPKTGVHFIPGLGLPDGRVIQDTSDIIDALDGTSAFNPAYPATPRQRLAALLFEVLADEWFVLPAMHYRWTKNRDFAALGFGAASRPNAGIAEQREIGEKLCARFAGSLPFLGITADTAPGIEAEYEAFLDLFSEHLKTAPYLLGGRPTLGDYALMGPLYAHQLRDPRSGEIMHLRAPRVVNWIERVNTPPATIGELAPDDAVAPALVAILKRQWAEFWPVVAGTLDATEAWLDAHPGETPPRGIGMQPFTVGGRAGERVIFPYTQWMWQRAADAYAALDGAGQASVAPFLAEIGLTAAFARPLRRRVARVNNRLQAA